MKRCDSFHWHLQYSHNRFEGSCGNFAKGRAQEKPRKTPLSSMAIAQFAQKIIIITC
jgi:hypothetical protein